MEGIDVDRARNLTPGCEHVLHLNHAGASLLPQPVLDAVVGHLQLEGRVGGYEAADAASPQLERTYAALAELLGAHPSEIALMDSSTRAWDMAVYSLPLEPQDRVLISRAEYASNAIALLQLKKRTGCQLVLVDDDEHGQIDLQALERELAADDTAMVSLVHVPTQGGLVNPAVEVGRLCREAGVLFVLDACQSVGQLPVDVDELGCAILAGNGRKFLRGPRGTGFLYMRPELIPLIEPVMLDLHAATWTGPDRYEVRSDARRFEMWEHDVAGRIGLGVAVDHALSWGIDAIADRNQGLAEGLRRRLEAIPRVTVHDKGEQRCAITTFTIDGIEAEEVKSLLRAEAVNVSTTMATSAQLDLPPRGLDSLVRASVHYTTTEEELDRLASLVTDMSLSA
ncbi:MAG: aminotransferase class V-fold PLP-dependent enzyme [Acidimicrobiales bacterium]